MLPANATNWIQVLNMSVFGPMKRSWCKILKKWRQETRRTGDVPKEIFPSLLRKLEIDVNQTVSSGFRCCGLYPLNRNEVLKRLPERATQNLHSAESTNISLNETLVELLKENCGHSEEDKIKRGKKIPKKKIGLQNVMAGRILETSVTAKEPNSGGECSRVAVDSDICWICKREDDVISAGSDESETEVNWIGCEKCNRWYHQNCMEQKGLAGQSCLICTESSDSDISGEE